MKKAQMSLEYVVKVLILLVVVAVVIGFIIKSYDRIVIAVKCLLGECPPYVIPKFPEKIIQNTFSSNEIATYIEGCYSIMILLPEHKQEDVDCYILIVNNQFYANSNEILTNLSEQILKNTEIHTNFDRDLVIIQFQDIGNKIIIYDQSYFE